ncbi:LysR family transcriptional regulator [Pseudooceanicola sp. CBS1P-1]|uniref:LysR family transcriptional regulator n=1 Tax=Pseudooceanicola albus TaxID=2692189 RepID=A0A6L7G983_9RHOB|nr:MULTISPECIES: LysR family transcriptional regulator [Pseudooceanicola]MBT9384402.1 LysR family transcriptional regulator [Pseudooceanicola endophyticus]MXN19860.1 LysR family transcriptional regulator [Pseudooceanicola albus]
MDMLNVMTTFVRVAQAGSLSAAGRDLGLSQSAVSQQIAALERHLDARLLRRTTRQMTLTEAGEAFFQRARRILEAVAEAREAASGQSGALRGPLRIHAPVGLGQAQIAEAAISFQKHHPEVVPELILDDRIADLTAEGIDVAIRFGSLPASSLVARRLGTLTRVLVAAPSYLARHGVPADIGELGRHRQVRFNGAPGGDMIPLLGPQGLVEVPVPTVFKANNAHALNLALIAGLGLGGAQMPLVRRALAEGRLVRVLPGVAYPALEVHALFPDAGYRPARVQAFVDHLRAETHLLWAAAPEEADPRVAPAQAVRPDPDPVRQRRRGGEPPTRDG